MCSARRGREHACVSRVCVCSQVGACNWGATRKTQNKWLTSDERLGRYGGSRGQECGGGSREDGGWK